MRHLIVPAAAAALLAMAPLAFAAETAHGTVKAVNTKAMTLTLTNGKLYHLANASVGSGFKAGDKVTVVYDMENKHRVAQSVTAQAPKPAAKPAG